MFTRTVVPNEIPLPWDNRPGQANADFIAGLQLDASAVSRFDQLLHEIHPAAHHVDVDRIASLAHWLHELPSDQAREVLKERLSRIELLRSMLNDADWDQHEATSGRVRKLLAYLDKNTDLIPDHTPVLGLLDDVMLLELAWPAVKTEAEDYADFCRYRENNQPTGDGEQRREAWIKDRLDALALLQHQARVNASHYVDTGKPEGMFRVK